MTDDSLRPSRPSKPQLAQPGSRSGRPVRPGGRSQVVSLPAVEPPPEPVIAETVLIAPPPQPQPPAPPKPPFFASVAVRQTLTPPCGVLGLGFIALGIAYFLQSPDAALRQVPASVPLIFLAIGVVSIACMLGLAKSVRSQ